MRKRENQSDNEDRRNLMDFREIVEPVFWLDKSGDLIVRNKALFE
jgi:hypothetical protein